MTDDSRVEPPVHPIDPVAPAAEPETMEPDVASAAVASQHRKARLGHVGLWLSLALAVAATGFGFYTVFLQSESPEEVALGFFESLEDRDILGTAANLLPDERQIFVEPLLDLVDEAVRLGVLEDTDVESVPGFSLEFTDLVVEIEEVSPDVAWASVSGSFTYSGNPQDVPFGPLVRRYLPEDWEESVGPTQPDTDQFDPDFGLALVRDGGKWYVSAAHTIAEAARRDANLAFPTAQPFPEPAGAPTPEGALEQAALALADVDLRGFIDVVRPGESLAFRRYSGLFMDDWDGAIADFKRSVEESPFEYSIDEIESESAEIDGVTVAWVTAISRFSASLEVPDVGTIEIAGVDGCITAAAPEDFITELNQVFFGLGLNGAAFDGETCLDGEDFALDELALPVGESTAESNEALFGLPVLGPLYERWFPSGAEPAGPDPGGIHFVVVEEDDRWYVSLTESVFRWMLAFTGTLDQDLLTAVGDDIQEAVEDPEAFAARIEEWAVEQQGAATIDGAMILGALGEAGLVDLSEVSSFAFPPWAGNQTVLLVWDTDVASLRRTIDSFAGPGAILGEFGGRELHAAMLEALGPAGTFGLGADEFPNGILLRPLDPEMLEWIYWQNEVLDIYTAEMLGLEQS